MLTLAFAGGVVAWWAREWIKYKFYKLKEPERLFLVCIVYPGHMVRHFWHLYPDGEKKLNCAGDIYIYNESCLLKRRWDREPQMWYMAGNPNPIDWDKTDNTGVKFNCAELKRFTENTIISQLLSSMGETTIIIIILVLLVVVLAVVGFILAKVMGWVSV